MIGRVTKLAECRKGEGENDKIIYIPKLRIDKRLNSVWQAFNRSFTDQIFHLSVSIKFSKFMFGMDWKVSVICPI
jgi:hypothetical protein